jgi:hypothetical protein
MVDVMMKIGQRKSLKRIFGVLILYIFADRCIVISDLQIKRYRFHRAFTRGNDFLRGTFEVRRNFFYGRVAPVPEAECPVKLLDFNE